MYVYYVYIYIHIIHLYIYIYRNTIHIIMIIVMIIIIITIIIILSHIWIIRRFTKHFFVHPFSGEVQALDLSCSCRRVPPTKPCTLCWSPGGGRSHHICHRKPWETWETMGAWKRKTGNTEDFTFYGGFLEDTYMFIFFSLGPRPCESLWHVDLQVVFKWKALRSMISFGNQRTLLGSMATYPG